MPIRPSLFRLLDRLNRGSLAGSLALLAALAGGGLSSAAQAQQPNDRYYLHDENVPPGVAGSRAGYGRPDVVGYFQPIRVELPGDGKGEVIFYSVSRPNLVVQPAPAMAATLVGHVYRLRISGMPEFPGIELYPSVELLDRLHPPPGRAAEFPIPITFSIEEIDQVLNGGLLTKVVYLEQPDRAYPAMATESAPSRPTYGAENPFVTADAHGRPVAIVRLGSRLPDANNIEPGFYTAAPLLLPGETPLLGKVSRPSAKMIGATAP